VTNLSSSQRKYLRGVAHNLKPVVLIGQKGLSTSLVDALDEALMAHELVKAKFIDDKDKAFKTRAIEKLTRETASELVGLIGHTAIFFRSHPDPDKRRITIPGSP
jgi:RNA-binding protein